MGTEHSHAQISLSGRVRPAEPMRDMPVILDLIEIGFRDELDPQGWKLLNQMRRLIGHGGTGRLFYGYVSDSGGFVWEEDQKVIANLSLRHAMPVSVRGRMIGNVVVHPDYRGQGIGRALMDAAVGAARANGAHWVGLEVRADNVAALKLYESYGFRAVGCIRHLLRPDNLPWPQYASPGSAWRSAKPGDAPHWKRLADAVYGGEQRYVLEIRQSQYTYGGVERKLNLWLSGQHDSAWVWGAENPSLALDVKTDKRYKFHIWDMLVDPGEGLAGAQEVVARALATTRRFPPWPVIIQIADQPASVAALIDIGFTLHRNLLQMMLDL